MLEFLKMVVYKDMVRFLINLLKNIKGDEWLFFRIRMLVFFELVYLN